MWIREGCSVVQVPVLVAGVAPMRVAGVPFQQGVEVVAAYRLLPYFQAVEVVCFVEGVVEEALPGKPVEEAAHLGR